MIYTYQDPSEIVEGGARRFFRSGLFPLSVIAALAGIALYSVGNADVQFDWFSTLVIIGYISLVVAWHNRHQCGEIRLSDDGTCELVTKRRVVRLHANEIRSVTYRRHHSNDRHESYVIRCPAGKFGVSEDMTGFLDFLIRLETLNPAVDLSSFPPDTWPGLHTVGSRGRGADMMRLGISLIFPVGITVVLVVLIIETITGKY